MLMMSQNRQRDKDRLAASIDHQADLKADLELALLNRKMGDLETKLHSHLGQVSLSEVPGKAG